MECKKGILTYSSKSSKILIYFTESLLFRILKNRVKSRFDFFKKKKTQADPPNPRTCLGAFPLPCSCHGFLFRLIFILSVTSIYIKLQTHQAPGETASQSGDSQKQHPRIKKPQIIPVFSNLGNMKPRNIWQIRKEFSKMACRWTNMYAQRRTTTNI